jgi:hypothetical protein
MPLLKVFLLIFIELLYSPLFAKNLHIPYQSSLFEKRNKSLKLYPVLLFYLIINSVQMVTISVTKERQEKERRKEKN